MSVPAAWRHKLVALAAVSTGHEMLGASYAHQHVLLYIWRWLCSKPQVRQPLEERVPCCTLQDMRLAWEEPFGPVVPVVRVKSVEEAVDHCNANNLALQGCVFTRDVDAGAALSAANSSVPCAILEIRPLRSVLLGGCEWRDDLRDPSILPSIACVILRLYTALGCD